MSETILRLPRTSRTIVTAAVAAVFATIAVLHARAASAAVLCLDKHNVFKACSPTQIAMTPTATAPRLAPHMVTIAPIHPTLFVQSSGISLVHAPSLVGAIALAVGVFFALTLVITRRRLRTTRSAPLGLAS